MRSIRISEFFALSTTVMQVPRRLTAVGLVSGPHLMHELQALARDLHAQARHAGEISSRLGHTVYHPECNRMAAHLEDNRDGGRRGFGCKRHLGATCSDDEIHLSIGRICGECGQPAVLAFRPAKLVASA